MPFTTFHFGPALLVGLLLWRYLDFPTFVAANVIVDWRAALVFLGLWPGPRHSWVHTYLGAFLMAATLAAAMIYIRPYFDEVLEWFDLEQKFSIRNIVLAAFSGVTIHITLDAFHHPTMHPFYPFMEKPLFGLMSTTEVTLLAFACLLIASPILVYESSEHSIDLL
jgi:hypothetical protein